MTRETDEAEADRESVIQDIVSGQYGRWARPETPAPDRSPHRVPAQGSVLTAAWDMLVTAPARLSPTAA